ncbi:zinc-binding dehydrogenase [Myxococcota bacterium]|nr:zinc-binding dehydrogenase [Myxococcota bacterium]
MKAWRVVRHGNPSTALEWLDVEPPEPGPGQIRVRTVATALNYNEVDGCYGRYRTVDPPLPYTLGMEVLGHVEATGPGCETWQGRRVAATASGAFGAHAELVVGDAAMAFESPEGLSDPQAAAFFFPFHVAHVSLFERGHLQAGETLLVHAGAGGVGSAAIQLGAACGARVIATAGSPHKLDACREFGADIAIDYRTEDFAQRVVDETQGRGVDVVCDLVGGTVTQQSFRCLAPGGRLMMTGFSGGIEAEDEGGLLPRPIIFGNFSVGGVLMAYADKPLPVGHGVNVWPRSTGDAVQRHLLEWLDAGLIRPVVGRVASSSDLPVELERMEARETVGRTILEW